MADRVRRINYAYVKVPNRPGQGARITDQLREGGVNLLAYTAFPVRGGKAQVDLIAEDMSAIRRIARKHGWRLSDAKKGFLVQGDDRGQQRARGVASAHGWRSTSTGDPSASCTRSMATRRAQR